MVREVVRRCYLLVLDSVIFGLSSLTADIQPCGSILPVGVEFGYSLTWFDFWHQILVFLFTAALLCQSALHFEYSFNHSGLLMSVF